MFLMENSRMSNKNIVYDMAAQNSQGIQFQQKKKKGTKKRHRRKSNNKLHIIQYDHGGANEIERRQHIANINQRLGSQYASSDLRFLPELVVRKKG